MLIRMSRPLVPRGWQLWSLTNDPRVDGNHCIVHQRSGWGQVPAYQTSHQPLPACCAVRCPLVLHGPTCLIAHWLLNSAFAFWQISFCSSQPPASLAFFFLSYFNKHLIHFLIPSLVPSNLYFKLALIFFKFKFQNALSCSQYFCDPLYLQDEAEMCFSKPFGLWPLYGASLSLLCPCWSHHKLFVIPTTCRAIAHTLTSS